MKSATFLRTFLLPILLSHAALAQPSRIEKRSFFSNALGLSKNYYVYLPEGYDTSTERYPVAYFLRGHEFEWLDPALPGRAGGRNLKTVADDLFRAGQIGKMIIVCPSTASEDYNNSVHSCGVNMLKPNLRAAQGIGTGRFEDYFVQDLIPHIDATWRTLADREYRAIDGFSLGGYNSTMLSLRHPDLFISVGSYDGTIMWYNLDDPRRPGAGPDDPIWFSREPYFDPVFDNPRNVPYMLLHSASNILRAADANQLDDFRAMRFHLSMTFADNVGNHSNNRQLLNIFAEQGIRNSFSNPVIAADAVHNYGFADMHAATTLVRHWQAFVGHKLNAPLLANFGVVTVGVSDTTELLLFNYDAAPLTVSSMNTNSTDYRAITPLPATLSGRYDTLSFKIVFEPSIHRALNDTMVINTSGSENQTTRIAVQGRGLLLGQARVGAVYATNSGGASQLFSLDRQSGAATSIGATGVGALRGLAIHPKTKELYATWQGLSTTNLYRLSSPYGDALLLAIIPAGQIRGIAFQADGSLFAVSATGRFYKITPSTGEANQIGSITSGVLYSGLSLNPKTGKLYASHVAQDRIYTINPNTGVATLVGSTGLGGYNPALAFGPDGTLYGITSTNNFIRIDTSTAAGTVIGPIGVTGMLTLALRTDSTTVSVDERESMAIAHTYQLHQNYPNPFNPSTTIRYALPHAGLVTLKIFNVRGQELATLVHEKQSAGEYAISWRPEGLPSGLYLYRLQAGDWVETKKMILAK
ncbi:T9SS type A sorting domain-containing protein [candidate division KSB1 bacterium]|nr:T9SS type A sorting domain-containing protein [candidate division KSB1 bacterium]